MKTIDTKEFDRLSQKFNPDNVCERYAHDFAREIDCGTHTGDYICLKCYLTVNECDRAKYNIGGAKNETD